MRIMLFFDLPTETPEDKKAYTKFRKFLIKDGFMMLQYSVYTKLALNKTIVGQILRRLELNKPKVGSIACLEITEKQFNHIKWLLGEMQNSILNSTDRITIYDEA